MPSASSDSGSGSDSDAPELCSLAASKESEKLKSEEIEKVQAALRRQTKRKNQERDRVLKEQAQRRKETASTIEARMERAMEEAQEEDSESSEWGGIGAEPVPEMDDDEDMEVVQNGPHEQTSDEGNCGLNYGAESSGSVMPKSINRLPDHLFEAAFASQKAQLEASTSTIQNPTKSESVASASARGKKMIRKTQPKDVVIGSRTIRTLSSTLQISKQGAYMPTQKTQKYINRSLALKGGNSRVRGWQRMAANIGVMRHSGPAANFVRS